MSTALAHAALAIATALFDSLWEGAPIVGAVWLGLRCLPKLGAATRYAVWLCALAALVLIPILTAGVSERSSAPAADPAATSAQSSASVAAAAQPRTDTARAAPEPASAASEPALAPVAPRKPHIAIPQGLAVAAALAWMLLACARGLLLSLDVRALAGIRRGARLWSTAHDYPVFLSHRVRVPLATGFLRPAVILPASLVERLAADAVETIVIHEVAHLRRYDVWTNALARIAEAFVVLNPAAWFVMRRLSMEREIACDDWVVARTGAGDAFAQTLATLAGSAGTRVPVGAPSAVGSRHAVVVRIERLLDSRPRYLRLSPSALGGAIMVLALIAFAVQAVSPVLAYEPQRVVRAQGPTAAAAGCAVPNRGIQMTYLAGVQRRLPKGAAADDIAMDALDPRKIAARVGSSNVATFDLTVDAAGKPRKVVVLSAPRYPGMAEHVTRLLMASTYEPALHGCVPVAATVRAGAPFRAPESNTVSVIVPVYPSGWSARHPSACKVPTVTHARYRPGFVRGDAYTEMLPALPEAMNTFTVDASASTSVRVHLDAANAVTSTTVVGSSGQPAFDDAVVAAAGRASYPLTASTCKPLPTDYVWHTTFRRSTIP